MVNGIVHICNIRCHLDLWGKDEVKIDAVVKDVRQCWQEPNLRVYTMSSCRLHLFFVRGTASILEKPQHTLQQLRHPLALEEPGNDDMGIVFGLEAELCNLQHQTEKSGALASRGFGDLLALIAQQDDMLGRKFLQGPVIGFSVSIAIWISRLTNLSMMLYRVSVP